MMLWIRVALGGMLIALQAFAAEKEASPKRILIDGSSAFIQFAKTSAASFANQKQIGISVDQHGSKIGYQCVREKTCQIGMATQPPAPGEENSFIVTQLGWDGLAIVTSVDINVENLTTQQVKDIFTGKIKNWKEVGGPDLSLKAYTRDSNRGARELFDKHFGIDSKGEELGSTEAMVNFFKKAKASISYMSFGSANPHRNVGLRIVKLDGVDPSADSIRANKYTLKRPLFLVRSKELEDDVLIREIYQHLLNEREAGFPKYGFVTK